MRSTRAVPTVRMLTVRTLIVKRPTARRLMVKRPTVRRIRRAKSATVRANKG